MFRRMTFFLVVLIVSLSAACDATRIGNYFEERRNHEQAAYWYRRAASNGDPEAQYRLACLLQVGFKDPTAIQWYQTAAQSRHPRAARLLGQFYYTGFEHAGEVIPQSYSEAAKWFRVSAIEGDAGANGYLASMYSEGHGVRLDRRFAYLWSVIQLSQVQEQALHVPKSTEKLVNDYRRALSAPEVASVDQLLAEIGEAEDAVSWRLPTNDIQEIEAAALAGSASAGFRLGLVMLTGDGVPPDEEQGLRWLDFACQQDLPQALHERGFYAFEKQTSDSFDEAMDYFEKAASLGYSHSQFTLALFLSNKTGNESAAARWFEMAATNGHLRAQQRLGDMFLHGDGVSTDPVQAYRWYTAAVSGGLKYRSSRRDELAATLSASDLERAESLAIETAGENASYSIGCLYSWGAYSHTHEGPLVKEDIEKAIRFLEMGAVRCHVPSMEALAVVHAQRGRFAESCAWMSRAFGITKRPISRMARQLPDCTDASLANEALRFLESRALADCQAVGSLPTTGGSEFGDF